MVLKKFASMLPITKYEQWYLGLFCYFPDDEYTEGSCKHWPIQGPSLAVSSPYLRLLGLSNYWRCTPAKELVTNDCSVTFILHFSVYSRGVRLLHSTYISTLTADARISWIEIYLTSYTWDLTRHSQISCSVLIIIDNWIYICWWRTIDYWNTATVR